MACIGGGGGQGFGKEEAHSKSSYSVDASNLKVGYDPGDHFLFYTVPTWQKMMFSRSQGLQNQVMKGKVQFPLSLGIRGKGF